MPQKLQGLRKEGFFKHSRFLWPSSLPVPLYLLPSPRPGSSTSPANYFTGSLAMTGPLSFYFGHVHQHHTYNCPHLELCDIWSSSDITCCKASILVLGHHWYPGEQWNTRQWAMWLPCFCHHLGHFHPHLHSITLVAAGLSSWRNISLPGEYFTDLLHYPFHFSSTSRLYCSLSSMDKSTQTPGTTSWLHYYFHKVLQHLIKDCENSCSARSKPASWGALLFDQFSYFQPCENQACG